MTTLPALPEFLEARIAEDEAAASRHQADASAHGFGDYPARVLAECRAKRLILQLHASSSARSRDVLEAVLQDLASVHADHPDNSSYVNTSTI